MIPQLNEPILTPCQPKGDTTALQHQQQQQQLQQHLQQQLQQQQQLHQQQALVPAGSRMDTCSYIGAGGKPQVQGIQMDHGKPLQFNHEEYQYQMFAKPASFDCNSGAVHKPGKSYQPTYQPAHTDVRPLRQTMYIPVVPSNPGGDTEVTFPMTPRTMGQPDVTSACCVPVIPSQPGYRNLTPGILPGPCGQLNGPVGGARSLAPGCPYLKQMCGGGQNCAHPSHHSHHSHQMGATCGACGGGGGHAHSYVNNVGGGQRGCAQQTILPPSNVPGGCCLGLPDTFPAHMMHQQQQQQQQQQMCSYASQMPAIPSLRLPHSNGRVCTSASAVRLKDAANRSFQKQLQIRAATSNVNLREVYGSFGSYLIKNPYQKRHHIQIRPDLIVEVGNGFHWDYPQHNQRQCYVLERNVKCL